MCSSNTGGNGTRERLSIVTGVIGTMMVMAGTRTMKGSVIISTVGVELDA